MRSALGYAANFISPLKARMEQIVTRDELSLLSSLFLFFG
jgi:hypothetical protein